MPARTVDSLVAVEVRADLEDSAAVETFMFEVSAGKKLGQPVPAAGAVVIAQPQAKSAMRPASVVDSPALTIRAPKRLKKPRRVPSWMVSLGLHGALLVTLGCIGIPGLKQSFDFALTLSDDPGMVEEVVVEEIAIEPLDLENVVDQLATEVMQTSFTADDLSAETALADLASTSLAAAAVSDLTGMIGAEGMSEVVPAGDKLTASFFGTKVDGRRILYVLDNSGGMRYGGFEALVEELMRSVESLTGEQQFFVIFYSDMVYPMFHPRPVERFVPANDRFKKRLSNWLDSVEFSVGNAVDEAIVVAKMIKPDALYLLTDGDINTTPDGRKLAALVDSRGRDFPIHTFLIGKSTKAAENLRLVAEANGGTFRIVQVTPEAKARASEMNRPYHNKEPGRDWGLNVGRGWGKR
jgi:hypothetical protein